MKRILYYFRLVFKGRTNAQRWYTYNLLKSNGLEAIKVFSSVIKGNNAKYWLHWGTLLGCYREKDFIKHDGDIDIAMFRKDVSLSLIMQLINNGFEFMHAICTRDGRDVHIALLYKKVKFDIYCFNLEATNDTMIGFCPRDLPEGWSYSAMMGKFIIEHEYLPFAGIKEIIFQGVNVYVPSNEQDILEILYGENFMTPIPGFKPKPNNKIILTPLKDEAAYYYKLAALSEII